MTKARINVDELSFVSLFLQTRCNGLLLAKAATGFVVSRGDKSYLITNWHVLAGRHPRTNQPLSKTAALPDELLIAYHRTVIENGQTLTGWCKVSEPLQDFEGKHRWLEHPTGKNVDVVAFPVAANDQVTLHPLSLALAKTNLFAGVGGRRDHPIGDVGSARDTSVQRLWLSESQWLRNGRLVHDFGRAQRTYTLHGCLRRSNRTTIRADRSCVEANSHRSDS